MASLPKDSARAIAHLYEDGDLRLLLQLAARTMAVDWTKTGKELEVELITKAAMREGIERVAQQAALIHEELKK